MPDVLHHESGLFLEWAVEVPGRGFVAWTGELLPAVEGSQNRDDVVQQVEDVRKRYERMGCPEIAETVRLVAREVTVSRTDWTAAQVAATS